MLRREKAFVAVTWTKFHFQVSKLQFLTLYFSLKMVHEAPEKFTTIYKHLQGIVLVVMISNINSYSSYSLRSFLMTITAKKMKK